MTFEGASLNDIDFDGPEWSMVPETIRRWFPNRSLEYCERIRRVYTGESEPAVAVAEPEKKAKPRRPRASTAPSLRGANLVGGDRPPTYDYIRIARLWSEGKKMTEICDEVGCGLTTVRTALKKIQPAGYSAKPGAKKVDECQRGHDMNIHGKPLKKGGRMCNECKRLRDRQAWRRKQERLKESV